MRQLPLAVSPDELIVGNQTHRPHGAIFHDESTAHRPSVFQFLNLNSDLDAPDYKLVIEKGVLAIKQQLEEKPAHWAAPLAVVWMKSTLAAPRLCL